jgi:hypothetical protein
MPLLEAYLERLTAALMRRLLLRKTLKAIGKSS